MRLAAAAVVAAVVALALSTLGCRSPTQISVDVNTDVPCAQFKGVTITVGHLDEIETKEPIVSTGVDRCSGDEPPTRLGSLVVTPSGSKDEQVAIKVVVGVNGAASLCKAPDYKGCIVARRALRFVPHEPLDLPISMAFSCLDNPCDPKSTCIKDVGCVPATIEDSTQCKGDGCSDQNLGKGRPTDGGVPDSTIDGGPDAGPDGDATVDGGPVSRVLDVTLGTSFACAELEDRSLKCWGQDAVGQLGDDKAGSIDASYVPVRMTKPLPGIVRQISAGDAFMCALLENQTVSCWGQNEYGECGVLKSNGPTDPKTVTGLAKVAEVAAGVRHGCARLDDGNVWCWGHHLDGTLGDGKSVDEASLPVQVKGIGVAAQITPLCARNIAGEVWCWGEGIAAPQQVPGLPGKAIDVTDSTEGKVIVVVEGGGVYWARRDFSGGWSSGATALATPGTASHVKHAVSRYGETYEHLEDGSVYVLDTLTSPAKLVPGLGPGSARVLRTASSTEYGRGFQCVVLVSGGVRCWGTDLFGELGIDRPSAVRTAKRIPALSGVSTVRRFIGAYRGAVVAIKGDGTISAWGTAPVLSLTDVATPQAMSKLGGLNRDMALGRNLTEGYVVHKGDAVNSLDAGDLGSTGFTGKFTDFDSLLISATFHFALRRTGTLEFLATADTANTDGIFGKGDVTAAVVGSITPVTLPATPRGVVGHVDDFGTGNQTLCAWLTDQSIYCWGDNQRGLCGSTVGSEIESTPQKITIPGAPKILTMAMSTTHACAVSDSSDGQRVYCWGDNGHQQLGVVTPTGWTNTALPVPGLSSVAGVTCLEYSTCVWLADVDKTVWCWGDNSHGELGDGTLTPRPAPQMVPGLKGVIGMDGSCAVHDTGEVSCWGESYSGESGLGISGVLTTPTDVKGL